MAKRFGNTGEAWEAMITKRVEEIVTLGGAEVHRSMVEGSEITGAPGQPRKSGALRDSFKPQRLSPLKWRDTSDRVYAQHIESGIGPHGPLTLRSPVGGSHSVAQTRAGWKRIVDAVTPQAVAKVPG